MNSVFSNNRPVAGLRRHGGFTLVELLVVMAIMGLLAAIMIPTFGRVREIARRTSCMSNMRQLGMAFRQYAQDNGNKFPNAVDGLFGADAARQGIGWTSYDVFGTGNMANPTPDYTAGAAHFSPDLGSLFPYAKSTQIYVCPSDSEGAKSGQSYAINACVFFKDAAPVCGGTDAGDCRRGKSMTRFRDETGWMLLAEEARNNYFPAQTSTDDGYLNLKSPAQPVTYSNYFSTRHSAGSVIAFVDGHAKWYLLDAIVADRFQIGGPRSSGALADGCPSGVN